MWVVGGNANKEQERKARRAIALSSTTHILYLTP